MGIARHIPNTITSLNLACGATGVAFAAMGHLDTAFLFMLGGAVADFLDGFSARLLGAYSPMGKELDSIADTVTFGLLPAFMLFKVMHGIYGIESVYTWIPLLIAVFSGLRLAKFNIDERQTCSFLGLPTPGCAMVCGALASYLAVCPERPFAQFFTTGHPIAMAALVVLMCALLVCEIPMFSMKMHKGEGLNRDMVLRLLFAVAAIASVIVTAAVHAYWTLALFIAFSAYILINLAAAAFVKKK